MKKFTAIFTLFAAGLCAAQSDPTPASGQPPATAKKKKVKQTAAKKTAPQPPAIPAGAVPNPDGTYAYTDKAGKKWTYAKTPFGVMKSEESVSGGAASSASAPNQWTKVTDNGETVKFERQTPFGPIQTEKKKSDLTEEERGMLDSQTANSR